MSQTLAWARTFKMYLILLLPNISIYSFHSQTSQITYFKLLSRDLLWLVGWRFRNTFRDLKSLIYFQP